MGVCSNHYRPFNKAVHCSMLLAIVNYTIPGVNWQNTHTHQKKRNCQFWQQCNRMTAPLSHSLSPPPPPPPQHPIGFPSPSLLQPLEATFWYKKKEGNIWLWCARALVVEVLNSTWLMFWAREVKWTRWIRISPPHTHTHTQTYGHYSPAGGLLDVSYPCYSFLLAPKNSVQLRGQAVADFL